MNTAVDRHEKPQPAPGAVPLRFVTAASLFDGHDAAINIIRRLIQQQGGEVIHLGHNRSVADIVRAALQEDADGIAVSSYQGGHMEYFKYMVDMLREAGAEHVRVVVGGGGTIVPHEIAELEAYGVEKVYSPDDGMRMGLKGMIDDVIARVRRWQRPGFAPRELEATEHRDLGRTISLIEHADEATLAPLRKRWAAAAGAAKRRAPVIGITGTGGAGKSSLTDELLNRFRRAWPDKDVAVIAVDPTRRRTGGALLGDRIRMNSLSDEHIYMRSIATRREHLATSPAVADAIALLRASGFGLIILETAGIGQSDTEVVDLVDYSVYVMTSEYGAASQLEKIGMLDYADLVAINKAEKRGAKDALRDVRKQWKRNRQQFKADDESLPVFLTIASQFNDPGVNRMFKGLVAGLTFKLGLEPSAWRLAVDFPEVETEKQAIVPAQRVRYLAEIAEAGRAAHRDAARQAEAADRAQACHAALQALGDPALPTPFAACAADAAPAADASIAALRARHDAALAALAPRSIALLKGWDQRAAAARSAEYAYEVRGREVRGANYTESLSHLQIPKLGLPRFQGWGDRLRWLLEENLPGHYPYTAGVYPYRRTAEDPARMFAGEGTPERTNRRFHYVSQGQPATRLSTAFDSCTLYGEDPDPRPDIYGRIGNSGVSIASVDDMKKLYSGFDLTAPTTSVSMTINGPAPIILAMYMNAAIDQAVERHLHATGGWAAAERRIAERLGAARPRYDGELPATHDGRGLGLLGVSGDELVDAATYARIKGEVLAAVRGTVQADILKEDQAQNTCIFSTDFALRMMGDVAEYFSRNKVRNFYSVSISGYHIAEAGANPISQLAFTLANGFTIVEYYLARGMAIDDFAPNLSFFFSNGMDPEYAVIGRVARRIWARAMRDRYGADPRSQMLKYHIQTSGRSLHAQEVQFNDIRTTLQALYALYDNCNSLHTNAYDEAITTPTEESVRRALAIQLIINKELGLNRVENPLSGSFAVEELTDLVEEAVYKEFEALTERGGVLGAMETMYQRGKIQEESLYYEALKHDGTLPIVGVNTFKGAAGHEEAAGLELIRSTEAEKQAQIRAVEGLRSRGGARAKAALAELQHVAASGGNTFEALMETVKVCSLGQISGALYAVGGRYRRSM
jgi:methylmalonyl-CoA mutase